MPRNDVFDHHFDDFQRGADNQITAVLSEVSDSVRWEMVSSVPINIFRSMRDLAIFDLWFKYSDEKLSSRLNASVEDLDKLRENKDFSRVKDLVLAALDRAVVPMTFADHLGSRDLQDKLFRQTRRLATQNEDLKVAERASSTLIDRISPVAQKGTQPSIIVIQTQKLTDLEDVEKLLVDRGDLEVLEGEFARLKP